MTINILKIQILHALISYSPSIIGKMITKSTVNPL